MAASNEFDVAGEKGWVIPSAKDDQFYNEWASKNRFKVNDTLKFEYQKDSVMVVSQEEYEKCRSAHPMFFSNAGKTVVKLERAGLYYFISGVSGHCERGLKMIVKVLELETPPPSDDHTPGNSPPAIGAATPARMPFLFVSLLGTIIFM
ncbi:early nodulin-like protein 1 [Ipomoea triloba]|uniref:early nodulin-like protein 1 n=1 Tax=Ipomoea triloba TaxID=35885 RepID=UPI00125E07B9|nr:early nodulin-like protein 1 [Ipomoea triloba]